jgi:hypothetical protein
MRAAQPFAVKVELHSNGTRRFRWSVFDAGRLLNSSLQSFATIREAQADADKFIQALVRKRLTIP